MKFKAVSAILAVGMAVGVGAAAKHLHDARVAAGLEEDQARAEQEKAQAEVTAAAAAAAKRAEERCCFGGSSRGARKSKGRV